MPPAEPNLKPHPKPHLWLITALGVIVPRRLRADWRQEWEAELVKRESMLTDWDRLNFKTKLDLIARSLGAFWDALWLQQLRLEDEMFQDLRFGLRILLKHPGFASIAVLTLALAIGANTAIFSVVNALVVRPLPYPDPERLIWIEEVSRNDPGIPAYGGHFLDWQEHSQTLEGIAQIEGDSRTLTGLGEAERLDVGTISSGLLPVLGVHTLALGRNFTENEDKPRGERVAILRHDLWQKRFNSDP